LDSRISNDGTSTDALELHSRRGHPPFDHIALRTFAHDGARWSVLADLCRPLGIAVQEVAARLEDYECTAVALRTAAGRQEIVVAVNAPGLHSVL
jgi:prophage antirepressor-like protein